MRHGLVASVSICSVVAALGCGRVKNDPGGLPDAPPGPEDARGRGRVVVTVLDPGGSGSPAVGARVVFLDPDGTLVKRTSTDTLGKADAEVLPGASVTAITSASNGHQIQTVLAIEPDDDLVIGVKADSTAAVGTFTVEFPVEAGATSYRVAHACGVADPAAQTTTVTFDLRANCRQPTMEVIVTAFDANGAALGFIAKQGVVTNAGKLTLVEGYTRMRTFTGAYSNIDSSLASLAMARRAPDIAGIAVTGAASSPFPATTTLEAPSTSGGSATIDTTMSRGAATRLVQNTQIVRQVIAGGAVSYGLDVGAMLLPWISQPAYDAATRTLAFTKEGAGTGAPDAYQVVGRYTRTDPMGQTSTAYMWSIIGPEATNLVLPVLPDELAELAPTAADAVNVSALMFDADNVPDYSAIRRDLGGAFRLYTSRNPGLSGATPIRTPATTVRISQFVRLMLIPL